MAVEPDDVSVLEDRSTAIDEVRTMLQEIGAPANRVELVAASLATARQALEQLGKPGTDGFATKLRPGLRVHQGDTIGYVGMTGLATAPHLHYEYRIAGVHKNPRTVPLPQADPIAPEERAQFLAQAAPMLDRLALVRAARLAQIDP